MNFEVSLFVYDRAFCGELRSVQAAYAINARPVDLHRWRKRSRWQRGIDNVARLLSPLL